jgi:hypothetical protein
VLAWFDRSRQPYSRLPVYLEEFRFVFGSEIDRFERSVLAPHRFDAY